MKTLRLEYTKTKLTPKRLKYLQKVLKKRLQHDFIRFDFYHF